MPRKCSNFLISFSNSLQFAPCHAMTPSSSFCAAPCGSQPVCIEVEGGAMSLQQRDDRVILAPINRSFVLIQSDPGHSQRYHNKSAEVRALYLCSCAWSLLIRKSVQTFQKYPSSIFFNPKDAPRKIMINAKGALKASVENAEMP